MKRFFDKDMQPGPGMGEGNVGMNIMSPIRKDFLASNLRSQRDRLSSILNNIEEDGLMDGACASDSLKEVELNLRQIRKLCVEG